MSVNKSSTNSINSLTITRPDDCHVHLRDDAILVSVLPHTARQFARAIVMPNLKPPVTTTAQALAYRKRILAALPAGMKFEPLMTLYLTNNTSPDEIRRAKDNGLVHAVKFYPAGATTNSDAGVTDLKLCYPALEEMQKCGLPFSIHGEVTDPMVDVFDREEVFIERVLQPLRAAMPELKIVLEHITTRQAADYVRTERGSIAATITPQHLLYNRNAIFQGGIRPHFFCLPVLKREIHRQALVQAATSGNPRFFLGTDSAPHAKGAKENSCGCAGCYTALHAMELYAQVFDQAGALDKLEKFCQYFWPGLLSTSHQYRQTDVATFRLDSPGRASHGRYHNSAAECGRDITLESYLNMVKGVDWSAPWLTPIRKLAAEVSTASNWRIALNAQAEQRNIRNHLNLPLHFIPQQELPEGTAYEAHISATGKVPTRDNLHDFFNALVWLIFPKIKAQLNGLHAKQIACSGTGKSRGAARDAATLFDENAALLTVADTPEGHAIVEALRAHQWHRLFLRERQQFMTHAGVCLFGHALMEKLVRPYKAITAHTLVCWVTLDFHQMSESEKCAQLDNQIADQLEQIRLLPAIFSPLPVLGIPGWWPDQTADFYADEFVFRLKRQGVV